MQKIHRRKNDQITKQFPCTEGCGKAYGSYAALYTHVKNKHLDAKLPEMKAGALKIENVKKVVIPNKQPPQVEKNLFPYDCKICKKIDCQCEQDINTEQLDRGISVMADQTFIKFINFIGILHYSDKLSWIRNTQQSFQYFSKQKMREMVYESNVKYASFRENSVNLSNKWLQYLSFSSRVIDKASIHELYNAIFMILSKDSLKDIENIFNDLPEFQTIRKCIQSMQKEWSQFMEFIKVI